MKVSETALHTLRCTKNRQSTKWNNNLRFPAVNWKEATVRFFPIIFQIIKKCLCNGEFSHNKTARAFSILLLIPLMLTGRHKSVNYVFVHHKGKRSHSEKQKQKQNQIRTDSCYLLLWLLIILTSQFGFEFACLLVISFFVSLSFPVGLFVCLFMFVTLLVGSFACFDVCFLVCMLDILF